MATAGLSPGRHRRRRSAGSSAASATCACCSATVSGIDAARPARDPRRRRSRCRTTRSIVATGVDPLLLRPRRVGRHRARPQDARRRGGDPPPGAAGLRAGRARAATRPPARAADVRRDRRRADRRRAGRRASPRSRAQALRDEFDRIDAADGADRPARRRARRSCRPMSRVAARLGAPGAADARRRGAGAARRSPRVRAERGRGRRPRRIAAGTIVWAAGVQASPLGRLAGRAGRSARAACRSSPDLSVPGHPEIFVAGDLMTAARRRRAAAARRRAGGHAGRARRGAATLSRRLDGRPTAPFRYRDPGNMATIGRARAIADLGWIRLTGYPGVAGVAVPPPAVPDRIQEPRGGADAVAGRLRDATAGRSADHGRSARSGDLVIW